MTELVTGAKLEHDRRKNGEGAREPEQPRLDVPHG
jgi:hypothetical protein